MAATKRTIHGIDLTAPGGIEALFAHNRARFGDATMALDSTTNAAELTQETVLTQLVQPLSAASQFLAAGPRIIDTAGPVRIPKLGSSKVATPWIAQNELIPDSDVDFDEIQLLPSTMKSLKTLTKFSNELSRQSVIALDAAIQQKLVSDVAGAMDSQLLSASGDGITTPKGLFAYSGIQNLAVGGALNLDHLLDAQGLFMGANANVDAAKWVFTSGDFIKLRKLKDTSGHYLVQPDVARGAGFTLFGVPVIISNRVPNTTGATPTGRAALVDFSQITVARDVAPAVKLLDQTFGDYDQQAIRVVYRLDAAPVNPEAIVALTGITR